MKQAGESGEVWERLAKSGTVSAQSALFNGFKHVAGLGVPDFTRLFQTFLDFLRLHETSPDFSRLFQTSSTNQLIVGVRA